MLSGQVCCLDPQTLHLSHAITDQVSMLFFQGLAPGFDYSSSEAPCVGRKPLASQQPVFADKQAMAPAALRVLSYAWCANKEAKVLSCLSPYFPMSATDGKFGDASLTSWPRLFGRACLSVHG